MSSQDPNTISRKKPFYQIKGPLRKYLEKYGRTALLPVSYQDLMHSTGSFPLLDKKGEDTLWETLTYPPYMVQELNVGLTMIYALLKTDGDMSVMEHLYVDRIDYCTFGNSRPFRVRIVNHFNDNYDYFYVKTADSSRIYGLELEHILSPNRINFLVWEDTLVEEHIAGIPGDQFIKNYLSNPTLNKVRVAKEFVKFNERSFVRLLGDMRSYNYVVDITPDFDSEQYRVRSIDFDQQCHEGRRTMYLPQYFKDNNPIVDFCIETMTPETIVQYQNEERTLMARRYKSARLRIDDLLDCMVLDRVSTSENVAYLAAELAKHHADDRFLTCRNMGELLRLHLSVLLQR